MPLRLDHKTLTACAAAALALCAALPAHSTAVTLTFDGTINYGYDTTGVFGTAQRSLNGLQASTTYSFDLSVWNTGWSATGGSQTITVDGVSQQYTMPDTGLYISRDRTEKGPGSWITYYDWWYWWSGYSYSYYQKNYDQLSVSASDYSGNGHGYMQTSSYVYGSDTPMNLPVDGSSAWTHTAQPGDYGYSSFYLYDMSWNNAVYFGASVNSVTLNKVSDAMTLRARPTADASGQVPEPASLLLAAAALAGLVAARRPQRRPATLA